MPHLYHQFYYSNQQVQVILKFVHSTNNIDIIVSHSAPLFAQPLEFSDALKHYNSFIVNAYSIQCSGTLGFSAIVHIA